MGFCIRHIIAVEIRDTRYTIDLGLPTWFIQRWRAGISIGPATIWFGGAAN